MFVYTSDGKRCAIARADLVAASGRCGPSSRRAARERRSGTKRGAWIQGAATRVTRLRCPRAGEGGRGFRVRARAEDAGLVGLVGRVGASGRRRDESDLGQELAGREVQLVGDLLLVVVGVGLRAPEIEHVDGVTVR